MLAKSFIKLFSLTDRAVIMPTNHPQTSRKELPTNSGPVQLCKDTDTPEKLRTRYVTQAPNLGKRPPINRRIYSAIASRDAAALDECNRLCGEIRRLEEESRCENVKLNSHLDGCEQGLRKFTQRVEANGNALDKFEQGVKDATQAAVGLQHEAKRYEQMVDRRRQHVKDYSRQYDAYRLERRQRRRTHQTNTTTQS
ncbi:hypothetical protein DENSPDRAFT_690101 [Dentipellis sp. KUC8613]|nr:hypothetical protein DENSPDRAFT_690101 [Dentipellis sp. KUC8613]